MSANEFITDIQDFDLEKTGKVKAQSPSNIALVKYWGKKEPQLPTNPSISFTLSESYTDTELQFAPRYHERSVIRIFLNGKEKPDFVAKINTFFDRIQSYAPYLNEFDFTIHTSNSFPHSSGIASSASGMSALAKCLVQMESQLGKATNNPDKRSSFLSRLGSGSACRSIYPGLVVWGESEFVEGSSDLFALPLPSEIHPVFNTFRDTILLIHEGAKSVSSTVGHGLMNNHPYAQQRFDEAKSNLGKMVRILKTGELDAFGELVEHEALSLHAMMLLSNPAFILMKPDTVAVLDKVWRFRRETKNPLFFTLDAGANVHLLYPEQGAEAIEEFIMAELMQHCQNGKAIYDHVNVHNV